MTEDVRSYLKTVAMILALLVVWLAVGFVALLGIAKLGASALVLPGRIAVAAVAALLLLAALCGLLVVARARRLAAGRGDLFLALNRPRSDAAFRGAARLRAPFGLLRRALGVPLVVGQEVKIKPLAAIKSTLDSSGGLDGLPFMPEMERFCGSRGRVFRVVDKVYDYGGKKDFRRLRNVVLLHGLRCDGAAHDGCQAACYLLWKTAWLEPGGGGEPGLAVLPPRPGPQSARGAATLYTCQYTQIVAASRPMANWDFRQYLRPLVAGNVTVRAFLTTLATLLFNAAQRLRGGIGFPWLRPGTTKDSVSVELDLRVGETVRVRGGDDIAATLNKRGRNKGLWFDRDMLKHVGQHYAVRTRVEKIIDDATRKMLSMQSPCILLEDVYGSGEFMRFCAQHDYLFWREAWLTRVTESPVTPTESGRTSAAER